jgi:hypothetical protein
MPERSRIVGHRGTPLPDQFPMSMQKAWDMGWRPHRPNPLVRLYCLGGCGASMNIWDEKIYSFICTGCRAQAMVALKTRQQGG